MAKHSTRGAVSRGSRVLATRKGRRAPGLRIAEPTLATPKSKAGRAGRDSGLAVLDSIPAHVAVLDEAGRILKVNKAWLRFARENDGGNLACLGAGVNYLEVCRRAATNTQAAMEALRGLETVLRGSRKTFSLEYSCDSPAEQRWFLMTVTRLTGGAKGAVVVHTDVTAAKRSEAALRESEERLRAVANNLPESAVYQYVTHGEGPGRITYVSAGIRELTGLTAEEVLRNPGRLHGMILPEYFERLMKEEQRCLRDLADFSMEVPLRRKDGEVRWMRLHSRPRRVADGRVVWEGVQTDVTERRMIRELLERHLAELGQAKENLARQNEELQAGRAELEVERGRYRKLFDCAPDAYFVTDLRGRIQEVNRAGCRLLGKRRDFLLHVPLVECIAPVEAERVRDLLSRFGEEHAPESVSVEGSVRPGRGEPIACLVTVNAVKGRTGGVTGLRWLVRDISARKRAEELLRESESRYRTLFESIDEGFCIIEALLDKAGNGVDYRFLTVNPAFERQTGLRHAVGRRMRELAPRHEEHWFRLYGEVARTGVPLRFEHEAVQLHRRFDVYAFRVGAPEERKVGVLFNDITARKKAEEARDRLAEQRQLALDAARLGWWHYDPVTKTSRWDERFKQIFGVQAYERPNEEILARLHPEDLPRVWAAVEAALDPKNPRPYAAEYRIYREKRVIRWIEAHGAATFEGEGQARRAVSFVGTVEDITERKEFQIELERLVAERTAKLQELVAELEHFSYTITHDMRAPLRAMISFSEVLNEISGEATSPQQQEILRRITTSARRMDLLITDALNYSRVVRQELVLEPVDVGALLRGMLDTYPELQPGNADIRIEGRLPVVLGNEAGLTQCFSNMLGNAVKFVRPGTRPVVRVRSEQRDAWVRIWVEDEGIGISKEMLPRVFDMFSRGASGYEGTGIGLALVRKVLQRMGGRAGVESEEGVGSRFWLELRLVPRSA